MSTEHSQVEMLGAALDAYRLDNGRCPTTEQGLAALRDGCPASRSPGAGRDPTPRKPSPRSLAQPYVYRSPGQQSRMGHDVLSYSADGKPGGEGEDAGITSWG